jgi:CheY-like chemotaxis protein
MARILVVDDEPDITSTMAVLLEIEGHEVLTAMDGAHALKCLRELNDELVDLIITDWRMPRLDGLELCRILRDGNGTKGIPIVFISANRQEPDGRGELFDRFLVKPVAFDELLVEIKVLCANK